MRFLVLVLALSLFADPAQDGKVLYFGTKERTEGWLKDFAAQGGRRLEVVILPAGKALPNAYGDYVMGYGGQAHDDVALPNPAFFQYLDWVLKRAEAQKIQIALLAMHPDSALMAGNSKEKMFEWGRYLGRRYVKAKNLVWLRAPKGKTGSLAALEEGIRDFDLAHRFEDSGGFR